MDVTLEAMIGLGAVPAALPVLVEHLKRAVRRETPWPLVTDALAVAWAFALRDAGLLAAAGIGEVRATTVVLIGLATGVAASAGFDGWRRLRPESAPATGAAGTLDR
ncbi:MAG: hypothetical protein O2798_03125 [Chloroflexi bacterium]|nr:hypothetical protein [Chloroflexota bacterium]MDA1239816.1 hypothetical protein [Chloroflexota bacterium]